MARGRSIVTQGKLAAGLVVLALVLAAAAPAASAPSLIKAVPRSGTVISLSWQAQPGEYYDIWQSTDGSTWQKVYTTPSPGTASYEVASGVRPYVNYYFLVSLQDALTDPAREASVANSTYIAPAYPPNVQPHAFYLKDTNLCAYCHRAHLAPGEKVTVLPSVTELCLTCHDGTQSKYNVLEGTVDADRDGDGVAETRIPSPAGPFGSIGGHAAVARPESVHTLGVLVRGAPGGNPAGTGEEWEEPLGCESCHDPHNTHNYRLLTVRTPDNADVRVRAFAVTRDDREEGNYLAGIDNFCLGCHKDYLAPSGAASVPASGTYTSDGRFRHPVDVPIGSLSTTLPLEGLAKDATARVVCLTCHYAHGSLRAGQRQKPADPDGPTELANYLLRLDYDSVCQDCHEK